MIPIREIKQVICELEIKLIELQNPEETVEDVYLNAYCEGVKDRIEIMIGRLKELLPK